MLKSISLLEGIVHIEDQPVDAFIKSVKSIKDMIVTEKLDGSNLWFGLDDNGLFTSREGKSPKKGRFYDVSDYPMVANYNGFRAAHLALEKVESTIREILQEGDSIEIEVLFGRQPNTVTYGSDDKNFIVILRGVNETPTDRVNALAKALDSKAVSVESTVVSSPDGDVLELDDVVMKWEFTQVKQISPAKIDTAEVQKLLSKMEKFADEQSTALSGKTNRELAEVSLTTIPKDQREAIKAAKAEVNAYFMSQFKLPIKDLLLSKFVRKIKPMLQASELHPSEDIGVEGVVARNPDSDDMIKIVDKDVFTAINSFNSSVRSGVSGLVRTTDQDAPIEMRGGVFGQAKIKIADALGAKELAMSSGVKRFITKFKGADIQSTASALADSLNISNVPTVRAEIESILSDSLDEVNSILSDFKKEAGEYKLMLKTGKEIGLTPEIMKRTLTSFAETKKDIVEVISRIKKAKTATELVLALYGKTLESMFEGGSADMKESFSLIRSMVEDEGGGGGEGGGEVDTETGSSSIAPYATRLGGMARRFAAGKVIHSRARNFKKPKKFAIPFRTDESSILKSLVEADELANATDVDDSAAARADVKFKQLRNTIAMGDDISQMQVTKYLDKAHEINDQVDTVIFGMEADDGSIVKVYVNADHAEKFEEALSKLLGQESDVEKVINDLSATFDIVDVEWPASMVPDAESTDTEEADADEPFQIDTSLASDEEETPAEVPSEDEAVSDELPSEDTPADEEETEAEPDEEALSDEELADASETDADETEAEVDDEVVGDETAGEEESSGEEESTEEPSDEETADESTDDTLPKKRKPKPEQQEESKMQTYGQKFKARLLSEAKSKAESKSKADPKSKRKTKEEDETEDAVVVAARAKYEKQVADLLQTFPAKQEKAIITLMINLGVPVKSLILHKSDIRNSIDTAADMYASSSAFKMWVKKFLGAMTELDLVTEASAVEKQLTNKYQHLVYAILKALGLPESMESTGSRALITGVRNMAKILTENNQIRIYVMAIANQLDVSDVIKSMPEPTGMNEEVVAESVDDTMAAVEELLQLIGLDKNSSQPLATQMAKPAFASRIKKVATSSAAISKMQLLNKSMMNIPGLTMEAVSKKAAADVGDATWSLGKLASNGLMLSCLDMKIKIDADEADKLQIGLEAHDKFSVSAKDGKRYEFIPGKKGTYVVKAMADNSMYPDGIVMSKDDKEKILDFV